MQLKRKLAKFGLVCGSGGSSLSQVSRRFAEHLSAQPLRMLSRGILIKYLCGMDEEKVANFRVADGTRGEFASLSECQLLIRAMPAMNHLIQPRTDANLTGCE
jgi:hypothetical protein